MGEALKECGVEAESERTHYLVHYVPFDLLSTMRPKTMAPMDSLLTYKIAAPEYVQGRHIRAARTLLDWTKARAAQECGVGINTIGRFEGGVETLTLRTVSDIVRTFVANGVIFVRADVGAGVLLRQPADEA